MLECYPAVICGRERQVLGWTTDGRLLLKDGEFEIKPIGFVQHGALQRVTRNPSGKVLRLARLRFQKGAWLLDGKKLQRLIDSANPSGPDHDSLARLAFYLAELPAAVKRKIVAALWCGVLPYFLSSCREIAAPNDPQFKNMLRAATLSLEEAIKEWEAFKGRYVHEAVKPKVRDAVVMYVTDPNMRSIVKIGAAFHVSRQRVSQWFQRFTSVTGFPVVTDERRYQARNIPPTLPPLSL